MQHLDQLIGRPVVLVDDLVDFVVGKTLDSLNVEHQLFQPLFIILAVRDLGDRTHRPRLCWVVWNLKYLRVLAAGPMVRCDHRQLRSRGTGQSL